MTQTATAAMVPIVPTSQVVQAGPYRLDLGDPDKDDRVFEGPIKIAGANGKGCTVSDDVALVTRPLALLNGKLLYVTTFSGSEARVQVVDAATCAVKWRSAEFEGVPKFTATAVHLPNRTFPIKDSGLPSQ